MLPKPKINLSPVDVKMHSNNLANEDAKPMFYCTSRPEFLINGNFMREPVTECKTVAITSVTNNFGFHWLGYQQCTSHIFSYHCKICVQSELALCWIKIDCDQTKKIL